MNMKLASIILAGASVSSAHTIFSYLEVDGVLGDRGAAIRMPGSNSPIQDVTVDDIACNTVVTASDIVRDVTAGSTVEAIWRHETSDVIADSHKGPVIAYMKKVDDALTAVGPGDGWFKISEAGLVDANGGATPQTWAVDDLISSNGSQQITIPSCIEDGQYLLRAEVIALHSASSEGGAQFYMECAQINVSGGTAAQTPSTVAFPGAYSATDPGILVNIYYPLLTNYTIPGPAVFTCDGSSTAATTAAAVAASSAVATSAVASSSAAAVASNTTVASVSSAIITSSSVVVAAAATSAASVSTAVQALTSSSVAPTTLQTSTLVATSATATTSAAAAFTSSAATMPAGTTLADLMAWLNQIIAEMLS